MRKEGTESGKGILENRGNRMERRKWRTEGIEWKDECENRRNRVERANWRTEEIEWKGKIGEQRE